jgi:acyl-CoA synthetase (AMP-forming)/AMP-acid ligase II
MGTGLGPEFALSLSLYGDRLALLLPGGRKLTYAELAGRADEWARDLGAGKKLVAIAAERGEHTIVAYLGALRAGHAVAMLPACQTEQMDSFAARFAPDFVYRRADGRWRLERMDRPGSAAIHDDLALLLGTSGTTGESRYVRLGAQALDANAASIADYQRLTQTDRAALILPIHYSYGLSVLNAHLSAGGSIYLSTAGAGDAGLADEILAAGCTNLAGVPYSFELMERAGLLSQPLAGLRFMSVAGGRLEPRLVEAFRRKLAGQSGQMFVMYGQTEATARISYVPPEKLGDKADSIGIVIPGGSLRLVGEDDRTVESANVQGDLCYRGPNVMMGYAAERADLSRGHEIEELRTGDIAMRDVDGFYRIVGRAKRISKIGGRRMDHAAIEAALASHGIDAAVAGDDTRLVVAYRSGQTEQVVLAAAMRATALPAIAVAAVKVQEFPRLSMGKIDYRRIAAMVPADAKSRPDVQQIFRQAFFPRCVEQTDSFETLGGDSLLYVQLTLALERRGARLPAGWEKLSIDALQGLVGPADGATAMPTDLLLRAVSILLIVVHHATLWPLPGGAATLMMLVGYGMARFHGRALMGGDVMGLLRGLATNLAVYAPIVIGFCLMRGEVLWPSVLLAGNLGFTGPDQMLPYMYWFVEAYAQIVLIVCGLFAFAPVRRAVAMNPFAMGMALFAIALAAKLLAPKVWPLGGVQIFTTPDVFYLAVLGWCACFAQARRQKILLLAVTLAAMPFLAWWGGNWIGSWVKFGLVGAAVLVLVFAPRLRVPAAVAELLLPVAAASYHIYLFHRLLPEALWQPRDQSQAWVMAFSVVSGVLIGLAAYWVQNSIAGLLARRRESAEPALAIGEKGS